jgi:multidrug resistance protein, MATE family
MPAGAGPSRFETLSWQGELRRVVRLAVPVVIGSLASMGMGTVDNLMVGRLGAEALATMSLATMFGFATMGFLSGVVRGMDPDATWAWGAGDEGSLARTLGHGVRLALVMAVPGVLLHFLAGPVLTALGQPAALVPEAARYCRILAIGVGPSLLFHALKQYAQAQELMRPATIAVLLANGVNFLLDGAFVHGWFGAPRLGAVGCAWATAACSVLMLLTLLVLLWPRLREHRAGLGRGLEVGPVLRLMRIGVPMGFQIGLEFWAFIAAGFVVGTLGPVALAAHAIAMNLASISFMMPLGISAAATTRVGNLRGAGLPWGRAAGMSIGLGVVAMTISASLFALLPGPLIGLYTDDPDILTVALTLLPVAALFQLFDGIQGVSFGVLRGLGDVRVPTAINIVGYWIVGVPVGALLALRTSLGPQGVWVGLAASLLVVGTLLLLRVWRLARRADMGSGEGSEAAASS